jgi:hypothetical protein
MVDVPFEQAPASAADLRRLDRQLLLLVCAVTLPATACVFLGRPMLGGQWFFGCMFVALGWYVLRGDAKRSGALLIAVIPPLMLLRQFLRYHAPIVLLATVLALWMARRPKRSLGALRHSWALHLLVVAALYWLASYAMSGEYYANLRVLEMSISATIVYLLGVQSRLLGTALVGLTLSGSTVAVSLLPHGERLGAVKLGEYYLGNPISVGLPLALSLVLALADDGRWLLLKRRSWLRIMLVVVLTELLLRSTSRGSWLVGGLCILVMLLFGSRQRAKISFWLAVLVCVVLAVLHSGAGDIVRKWAAKAVSPERTMAQRTSGRWYQWQAFRLVLRESPLWGHGPGIGREIYERYSVEVSGRRRRLAWHSLYLHVGAELGLFGMTLLTTLLVRLAVSGLRYLRMRGELVPLLGVVGFAGIALSVQGMDAASGLYLGLALLGTCSRPTHMSRAHLYSRALSGIDCEQYTTKVPFHR